MSRRIFTVKPQWWILRKYKRLYNKEYEKCYAKYTEEELVPCTQSELLSSGYVLCPQVPCVRIDCKILSYEEEIEKIKKDISDLQSKPFKEYLKDKLSNFKELK